MEEFMFLLDAFQQAKGEEEANKNMMMTSSMQNI